MRFVTLLAALTLPLTSSPAPAQNDAKLVVEIVSFRNDKGMAGCSLYASADGFPTDLKKSIQKKRVAIQNGRAICEFTGLPPGEYAVGTVHDENGNGLLDTNFIGIPKEGVGVSNDAKGFMGPPKFDKAKFTYPGGVLNIVIHTKYL